jgi:hypothetical protein
MGCGSSMPVGAAEPVSPTMSSRAWARNENGIPNRRSAGSNKPLIIRQPPPLLALPKVAISLAAAGGEARPPPRRASTGSVPTPKAEDQDSSNSKENEKGNGKGKGKDVLVQRKSVPTLGLTLSAARSIG